MVKAVSECLGIARVLEEFDGMDVRVEIMADAQAALGMLERDGGRQGEARGRRNIVVATEVVEEDSWIPHGAGKREHRRHDDKGFGQRKGRSVHMGT